MDMGLKGAVAVVTASSQGLGKATAFGLAEEGANLVMCARGAERLEEAAREIRERTGAEVLAMTADVRTEEGISAVIGAAVERFGRIDVLVTNAGGPPPGDFTRHSDEVWQRAFELNLLSVVRLVRAALPYLQTSGRGRIINFSSTSVKQPIEGLILSNSLRAGVIGMAKTLATELAPHGITVNNIAPGRIDTDRVRSLDRNRASTLGISEEEARQSQIQSIPLGRYGEPSELAALAVFLASDKASYITGTTIQVDGGLVKSIL
ncbi:MAG: 3-oxoacyl-[acyl-carrier protein] reductase [Chloroflexia bacterium]|jgi:3-oxoacyl-[acyl-carrier protein] reductase|nr:3-oxoacyl-[acyl-carrier protein] reductase [Chloroflexia bacterium]